MSRDNLMYGFVVFIGFKNVGKACRYLTFNTDDYNYYNDFTLSWIDGVGNYFLQIVDAVTLADSLRMTDACNHNQGWLDLYTTWT